MREELSILENEISTRLEPRISIIRVCAMLSIIHQVITEIVSSRVWKILDLMTYPLFLTHYMFVSGEFAVIH